MAMRYPARFEAAPEGGFVATFRDIPEVVTQGNTYDEAVETAGDALVSAMDFYFEDARPVPRPSKVRKGDVPVELSPTVSAKVLLLNEMLAAGVSNVELARRMGKLPQEAQ
jgi:antitoxin HicB